MEPVGRQGSELSAHTIETTLIHLLRSERSSNCDVTKGERRDSEKRAEAGQADTKGGSGRPPSQQHGGQDPE